MQEAVVTEREHAFEIAEINLDTGETVLIIKKGILGAMANQLKSTSSRVKGSSILRKLGYVLAECGDVQYGEDIGQTNLDAQVQIDGNESM